MRTWVHQFAMGAMPVLLALLAGCSSVPRPAADLAVPVVGGASTASAATPAQPASFSLAVGDEFDIKVPDAPLYDQTVKVRPDGKVTFNVIGTLYVLGRTPEDVQAEVRERYRATGGDAGQRVYLLHPNDELDIKFPYAPNFNEQVRVRPDGKIQLQLAGTVQAEGLSPEALQTELKQRYARVMRVPELSVILRSATSQMVQTPHGQVRAGVSGLEPTVVMRTFRSPQVFAAGEWARPGMFAYTPGMTLLQVLAQAGGQLPSGDIERLVVLRQNEDGTARVISPGLTAGYLAVPNKDMVLQPYDVVLLPQTSVATLSQNLDQYVYKVLPPLRNSSFGFVYNINNVK